MLKYKKLLLEQIAEKDIIDEEMGNDRFFALTKNAVYLVSIGVTSGFFFGKKIKSFPLEHITSIDMGKKLLASYMEITAAGMGGDSRTGASYTAQNENRIFFRHNKRKRFMEIAKKIKQIQVESKSIGNKSDDVADEIERLHGLMKKGVITEEEFTDRKKKILN